MVLAPGLPGGGLTQDYAVSSPGSLQDSVANSRAFSSAHTGKDAERLQSGHALKRCHRLPTPKGKAS